MNTLELTQRLKAEALRLGFSHVGIDPAVPPPGYDRFMEWLRAGRAAAMTYMEKHAEVRAHPDRLLDGVRSIVMVCAVYGKSSTGPADPKHGKIARYARGQDYHRALWDRLEELLSWVCKQSPETRGRAVVDTAPLLERDFARLAGLGWIGKNTMLINRKLGSFTVLGALLLDAELAPDAPHVANHCGTCTRCLEACPTRAFPGPYQLDAHRCISYWTIEHRGAIVEEFADQLHGWVFGCDVCQDVCPWNRKSPDGQLPELAERPQFAEPDLIEWLYRDEATWKSALKGTSLARAKRVGLVRNAALVLGAGRIAEAVPALLRRLADTSEDLTVRTAAAWALGRIGTEPARAGLRHAHQADQAEVRDAVAAALKQSAQDQNAGQPGLQELFPTGQTARMRDPSGHASE